MYGQKKQMGQKNLTKKELTNFPSSQKKGIHKKLMFALKIVILIRFSKTDIKDCHQNVYQSIFINAESVFKSCNTKSYPHPV